MIRWRILHKMPYVIIHYVGQARMSNGFVLEHLDIDGIRYVRRVLALLNGVRSQHHSTNHCYLSMTLGNTLEEAVNLVLREAAIDFEIGHLSQSELDRAIAAFSSNVEKPEPAVIRAGFTPSVGWAAHRYFELKEALWEQVTAPKTIAPEKRLDEFDVRLLRNLLSGHPLVQELDRYVLGLGGHEGLKGYFAPVGMHPLTRLERRKDAFMPKPNEDDWE